VFFGKAQFPGNLLDRLFLPQRGQPDLPDRFHYQHLLSLPLPSPMIEDI